MCVVGHDISELKGAQALLEDKERQLRQVIDSVPSPMCYVDADGLYRYVNNAFLDYIGLPLERIIGHPVREVLGEERWAMFAPQVDRLRAGEALGRAFNGWRHIYEDDAPAAVRAMQGLAEGRERHATLLHRNYRKDGSVIWVEWHSSALRDESGRVISILSLAQDVSSRI